MGLPPHLPVLLLAFDSAVVRFGLWAEGRAGETDKKGNRLRSLDSVLADAPKRLGLKDLIGEGDIRVVKRPTA